MTLKPLVKIVIASSILNLASCAVIHFENGPVVPDPEPFSFSFGIFDDDELSPYDASISVRHRKWYHHAVYQTAELSNPLETSQVCVGLDWNQITTEVTPFDAVMGLLDNALFIYSSSVGLVLRSVWSVEYSCKEQR